MNFESDMKTTYMSSAKFQMQKIILLLFSILYLCSCEKDGKLINDPKTIFETDYYEMELLVEEQDRKGFQIFAEEIYSENTALLLSAVGLSEEQVEEVLLKEAEMSILESDNYMNFNLLDDIELTIYTDTLGESPVAWKNPIPAEQTKLVLDLSDENILPYFLEGNFMLTSQGYLNSRIKGNLKLLVRVKFQIKGSL